MTGSVQKIRDEVQVAPRPLRSRRGIGRGIVGVLAITAVTGLALTVTLAPQPNAYASEDVAKAAAVDAQVIDVLAVGTPVIERDAYGAQPSPTPTPEPEPTAEETADDASAAAPAAAPAPAALPPVVPDPGSAQAIAHEMVLARGWGEDQFSCLVELWNHESGWNVGAQNASSGAYGIPQALPGEKMGPGWQTDATVQITWGLGYVAERYGNPCGAWGTFQSQGWY